MISGIGVDIVENKRIKKLLKKHGRRLLEKYLTTEEIKDVDMNDTQHLCGLFAAKEALVKAFGNAGFKGANYDWFEISPANGNSVRVINSPGFKGKIFLSIAHEGKYSVAIAVY